MVVFRRGFGAETQQGAHHAGVAQQRRPVQRGVSRPIPGISEIERKEVERKVKEGGKEDE